MASTAAFVRLLLQEGDVEPVDLRPTFDERVAGHDPLELTGVRMSVVTSNPNRSAMAPSSAPAIRSAEPREARNTTLPLRR